MIYLQLFLIFLKIGAVSFGGGYGMVSLIREEVLQNGWMNEGEFLNFIAVSESTPGPIAVNMATFIGATQAGVLGAFLATLGVILPSFLIILFVAAVLQNLLKFAGVNAVLIGVRPAVAGLVLATSPAMLSSLIFSFSQTGDPFSFQWKQAAIFLSVAAVAAIWKLVRKKAASPIILILISALPGILFYAF